MQLRACLCRETVCRLLKLGMKSTLLIYTTLAHPVLNQHGTVLIRPINIVSSDVKQLNEVNTLIHNGAEVIWL